MPHLIIIVQHVFDLCHHSFQAFTVTTIFNVLMFSLAILPFGIRAISEARIALRRLRVNLRYLKEAMTLFAVQCCLNILEPEPLELNLKHLVTLSLVILKKTICLGFAKKNTYLDLWHWLMVKIIMAFNVTLVMLEM